jgi:hypothetical protein
MWEIEGVGRKLADPTKTYCIHHAMKEQQQLCTCCFQDEISRLLYQPLCVTDSFVTTDNANFGSKLHEVLGKVPNMIFGFPLWLVSPACLRSLLFCLVSSSPVIVRRPPPPVSSFHWRCCSPTSIPLHVLMYLSLYTSLWHTSICMFSHLYTRVMPLEISYFAEIKFCERQETNPTRKMTQSNGKFYSKKS